jgi:sugar phosphate isomerase/epimerase
MLIGAMNDPRRNLDDELAWMARIGLEFVDLSLEPPAAQSARVDRDHLRDLLNHYNFPVVGHTAFYLPMASAIEELRVAAVTELRRCLHIFAHVGARWMNVHPDRNVPMHTRPFWIERNLESLDELLAESRKLGVGIMLENLPYTFNTVEQLSELLDPLPELGLHLDLGHSNLYTRDNAGDDLIRRYATRLQHVHLHDNKGGTADLHLPLGTGTVPYRQHIRVLQEVGYDGTITLEVFSPDRRHFLMSRDLLRHAWEHPDEDAPDVG